MMRCAVSSELYGLSRSPVKATALSRHFGVCEWDQATSDYVGYGKQDAWLLISSGRRDIQRQEFLIELRRSAPPRCTITVYLPPSANPRTLYLRQNYHPTHWNTGEKKSQSAVLIIDLGCRQRRTRLLSSSAPRHITFLEPIRLCSENQLPSHMKGQMRRPIERPT
jgi:hypothetical protein